MPDGTRPQSPEQLNQRIVLVRAPGWLAALAVVLVLASAIAWAFFGTVITQVSGSGILLTARNTTIQVQAMANARVVASHVRTGQTVKAGELLFELKNPILEQKLAAAKTRLKALKDSSATIAEDARKDQEQRIDLAGVQRKGLDEAEKQLEAQIEYDTADVARQEKLFSSGIAIQDMVEKARIQLNQARRQLADINNQRSRIEANLLQASTSWRQLEVEASMKVDDQQATVSELETELARATQIYAPIGGIALEVLVSPGQLVNQGEITARIGSFLSGYEIVSFLDPYSGKRVLPGMRVEIVPTTVARDEYGTMVGKVEHVSQRPVSIEEVQALVGNDTMARFLASGSPPIVVEASVETSKTSPSGFRWRNGAGPPFPVTPGTLTTVSVDVDSQPPITLVLPYLKRVLGLG